MVKQISSKDIPLGQVVTSNGSGSTEYVSARTVIKHGEILSLVTESGDYAASVDDYFIIIKKTANEPTNVYLPAGEFGLNYTIKDGSGNADTYNITIVPNGTNTLDGQPTFVINMAYQSQTLIWNSEEWSLM